MPKKKKKEQAKDSQKDQVDVDQEEESDLQKFVASALRQPRGGIYEQLLSQFLAQAVIVTDPLKRIKVVCEASLMVPEKDREDLAISYERVEVLNAVTNAFLNSSSVTPKDFGAEVVSISWGFDRIEENYEKYIHPWFKCQIWYHPTLLRNHVEFERVHNHQIPRIKRIIREPFWSWFFDATTCLATDGYNSLKNSFVAWAIPQVQLYLAELTQVVNPSVYAEVLGLYTRSSKGSYADKVKEATKPTEAGPSEA